MLHARCLRRRGVLSKGACAMVPQPVLTGEAWVAVLCCIPRSWGVLSP